MPTNNPSPDEILEAMKDYKCDVKVLSDPQQLGHVSGKTWKTTGLGNWGDEGGLIGAMMHHTAGVTPTKNNPVASLPWMKNAVINGENITNAPACNQLIGGYPGHNYILCGRVAHHSGLGKDPYNLGITQNRANFRLWGIEIESAGEAKDFNDYQLEQAFRSLAALSDLCGWPDNGKTIINHKNWAPNRRNDTLYSRNFWAKGMKKYLDPSGGGGGGGNNNNDDDTSDNSGKNIPDVALVTRVGASALGKSEVVGTPQGARFAIINLTNESIFLSDGDLNIIDRSNSGLFYVSANAIEIGDPIELKRSTNIKNASNELTIDTSWVQDEDTAGSVLNIISDGLNSNYIRVILQVFGNPLVQTGDIVQIKSRVYKLNISSDDYFIVTRVNHTFSSNGLSTQIELKPIKETLRMI